MTTFLMIDTAFLVAKTVKNTSIYNNGKYLSKNSDWHVKDSPEGYNRQDYSKQ